jgi:hypothetical protein
MRPQSPQRLGRPQNLKSKLPSGRREIRLVERYQPIGPPVDRGFQYHIVRGQFSIVLPSLSLTSHELSSRRSSPRWVKQVACASIANFWARSKSPAGEALHALFRHLRAVCQTATGIPDASVVRRTTRLPLDYHRSRLFRVYCRTTRQYGGAAKPLVCCDKHRYLSSLFQMKGNSQL